MQTECHMMDSCWGVGLLLKDHTCRMSHGGQLLGCWSVVNPLTSRTIADFPKETTKLTKNNKNSSKGLKYIQVYILLKDIEQRM